jgi:uncharacterized protein (TIGR01777 family)
VTWEGEAKPVQAFDCRLVTIRSGIVLSKDGGALKKMIPPFRFFAGGPLGSGRQQMSWIHRDDWIGLVAWAIRLPLVTGVINATAPNPVPNWEFSRTLGRAMRRPSWAPVLDSSEAHRRRNGRGGAVARTACACPHAHWNLGLRFGIRNSRRPWPRNFPRNTARCLGRLTTPRDSSPL